MDDLMARARAWLDEDPDPDTRAELAALLDTEALDDRAELADRFAGRLEFGTAGLRGALGAGPNRMNRVVVIRTAAGLARYLGAGREVVVGFDARHKSAEFARDTCAVLAGAGLTARMLPRPLPTPLLAFALRHLGADAGVMVTASHNPPQDNGYKVYLGDGSQIVPPADDEISAAIDAVGPVSEVPRGQWQTLSDSEVVEPYLERAVGLVGEDSPRELNVVHTPLHGVGGDVFTAAMRRAGFPDPIPVPAQRDPDPDFPTVAFPNPEEPGALDLALDTAREHAADLIIAQDPDADRCAVAVPDLQGPDLQGPDSQGWRRLTGDELGWLLAQHRLEGDPARTGTLATTIVSSSLLGKMAAAHGLRYTETLTGFKWLGRVPDLRFGYEEALGYCVDHQAVRDKDGISAGVLIAEYAARLRAEGRTLLDVLDDLARRYGVHATDQLSVRLTELTEIDRVLGRLRNRPPAKLGGRTVRRVDDLAAGVDGLPPTAGVRYYLSGEARVLVRPSGTEPKLKCYFEVVVAAGDDLPAARRTAAAELAALRTGLAEAAGLAESVADSGA